jgi:hypothetical protein
MLNPFWTGLPNRTVTKRKSRFGESQEKSGGVIFGITH